MGIVLSDFVTYMALLFGALFALDGIMCLIRKTQKSRKWCYIRQKLDIFLIQFLCYCAMCIKTKDVKYILLYGVVQVLLFSMLSITPIIYDKVSRGLLNNMCFLLGVGFIMISRFSFSKAVRQIVITGGAFLIALFIPFVMKKAKTILEKGWAFYGTLGAVLLAGVYILGEITNGSKLSFTIYDVSFQPSEFVKIIFVFFVASLLFYKTNPTRIVVSAAVAGLYMLVLAASKDLGAALIFGVTYLFMLFIATNSYSLLLAGMIAGVLGADVAYITFSHIQYRVTAWLDPFAYINGSGYQITQSLFAISSGGLFGVGLFNGNPQVIPYVEDDMIFAAICEEMGMLFGLVVIIVCFLSFFMIMQIGIRTQDTFHKLLCTGLAVAYAVQICLTIGGGVNFIPLTGVTLPFISYGGSSVMATVLAFFVVQGVYIQLPRKQLKIQEESVHESGKEAEERPTK